MTLEACISNLESLETSISCGIRRVELCSALELGGISPVPSLVAEACRFPDLKIMCLIRPREGNFHYSGRERIQILSEIEFYLELGAHGFVFGCLDDTGMPDIPFIRDILKQFPASDFTFHRAFDVSEGDPFDAVKALIDAGVPRLLSSGKAPSALQGIELLSQLNRLFSQQIVIMPGGGIRSTNLHFFTEAGFCEFHSSGSPATKASLENTSLFPESYPQADRAELLACQRILEQLPKPGI